MKLSQYLAILRRRKWIIIGTMLLTTLIAGLLTYMATPVYRSSTTLRVATVGSNISGGRTDIGYTDRLMNTYSRIVTGGSTRAQIAEELDLTERPQLSVELIPNTELLRINAEAPDPTVAQRVADAAALILIERSRELYAGSSQATIDIIGRQVAQTEEELGELQRRYEESLALYGADSAEANAAAQAIALKERTYTTLLEEYERIRIEEAARNNAVSVVEPAYRPSQPSQPRTQLNILLGILVGLFAGITLALLRENLDNRLYTSSQIETAAKLPTSGRIPAVVGSKSIVNLNGNSYQPQVEAFRRLRINVLNVSPADPPRSFIVTSPEEGAGKSTVCANLALSLAKSGRRVVLVDCDLHEPVQHHLFNLDNDRGLTSVLTKQAEIAGVLQRSSVANLYVITNGPQLIYPDNLPLASSLTPTGLADRLDQGTELLGSLQMNALLNDLEREFDVILLDTPAVLTVTDAAVLAPLVDHVLVVVARGRSQREALEALREQLGAVNVSSISLVVNYAEH